ncbi:hypothetical protein CK203_086207 [Vitis vinifera]|uniref:Retrotransposon gag domain-containing protein n=1 Tax=Vitis vinifera TaxID=29760 RepID=A0A438DXG0_VITVI|nr:hypothetical protein CK203_086207 [Vitis vinifera]
MEASHLFGGMQRVAYHRMVDLYHRATIDGFTIGFDWLAYHFCGFDSGGIDQFKLENGYSTELEQRIRRMRDPDETISWDDTDDMPMATLPVSFKMLEIKRYTDVGCPCIHLKLYNTVMRALGLDEAQLLTLFPLSLSDTTQRWFTSLESSHRRTWKDLSQEFLRQYSFSSDTGVTR